MSSRESFLFEHFYLHLSRESNNIYCFSLINYDTNMSWSVLMVFDEFNYW